MAWVSRILAGLILVAVAWALITAMPAVIHGHPAYAVLVLLATMGAVGALILHSHARPPTTGWRRIGSIALALAGVAALLGVVYLRPFSAEEPALTAMQSDATVTVTESATRIVLEPSGQASETAVLYQPGARVEARAYAAVLRPLAEAGHRVVIVKQPLGLALLAVGALADARADHPDVTGWVIAGHSLGGTVAAIMADAADDDPQAPATGLLLHASYPASDLSETLAVPVTSISGSNDGLATPADIEASRTDLPADTTFEVIDGAVHSFFGDYGPQPGDGEPSIGHDEARTQISNLSVAAVRAGAAEELID
jgi:pimeloyl-ACP methyl ester carboxylesterase